MKILVRLQKLGLVAGISFILNVGITSLLTERFGVAPRVSFATTLVSIFVINFLLTRYWVFSDRVANTSAAKQFLHCMLVSAAFRLAEWSAFAILEAWTDIHYIFLIVGILIVSFLTKSLVYDRFVFR
ncbi:GtrA family protein [Coraliomargarita parva]|uniref:GtrA family protein n=1 Tax=Coraliomargarita parva TaxID=3014050 RepID=UPI0022B50BFC|nr:GtrA family protein [Coraliomargarita parva]